MHTFKIQNPETLVFIGNGFDLDQGHKTSFTNFVESKLFNDLIYHNDFAAELHNKKMIKNWIDAELELTNYAKTCVKRKVPAAHLKELYQEIIASLENYLIDLFANGISIDESKKSFKLLQSIFNSNYLIIDFNYTSTIEEVFKKYNNDIAFSERYFQIHGSIKNRNIVFGVDEREELPKEYRFIVKSLQDGFTGANLNPLLNSASNIHFFGMSLGETDHFYFHKYLKNLCQEYYSTQVKNIHIHTYDKLSWENIRLEIDEMTENNYSSLHSYHNIIPEFAANK